MYRATVVRTLGLLTLAALCAPACLTRPLEPLDSETQTTITETLGQSRIDKIDLLLAIDNSGSMGDKQKILARAVPRLVEALVNPPCLDENGALVMTPASPLDECPGTSKREFHPVLDIHIGIISSALGTRGGNPEVCKPTTGLNNDDSAHLIHRTDALEPDGGLATFEDKGFLAWRPEETGTKPGLYQAVPDLTGDLEAMVQGVGENGCGYEAQLESWYRFLVEPDPYLTVEPTLNEAGKRVGNNVLVGTDDDLLRQRQDFLRPDSLVAVLMLTDENDCSYRAIDGYSTTYPAAGGLKARAECAININDPCCAPCGHAPESCPSDPSCSVNEPDNALVGLGCFDQKRRFGIDYLYPVQRYIDGLTQDQIADRDGQLVRNPLLVSSDGLPRGRDRVFFAGIVGVPWQLIARDSADLTKGFQDATELAANGTWDKILGDPAAGVPASDPHMHQSIYPRPELPAPTSSAKADAMTGHEWTPKTENGWGDLQYACIFDLPTAMQITCDGGYTNCDCNPDHGANNPLCQDPTSGDYGNVQMRAKGYPGLRQLSVMKGIGDQAIVGSICPAQMGNDQAADYGYQPAIDALVERLKSRLQGVCMLRSLQADQNGQVACLVLEGRRLEAGQTCDCSGAARSTIKPENQPAVQAALEQPIAIQAGLDCFCNIDQLEGDALNACQTSTDEVPSVNGEAVDGWCYIDAGSFPPVGNEALVEHCLKSNQPRTIRFVGEGEPVSKAMTFVSCQQ